MISLPEKFEEAIRNQLGPEFPAFQNSLESPPPVSIRLHPAKANATHSNDPVPWSAYGQYLGGRPLFTLDPLFHAGSYYVQEASSMFLEQAIRQTLDLNKPVRILDLCAAPGGKSTHILSLINRDSLLVSNETIRSRANILSESIQKWGYPNAIVVNNDPFHFKRLSGFFDVVVVDAPCSGEGLFRKDPTAIREWSPENVQLCASRQKRIISDIWDCLRENGFFIYCTCTFNPLENEENLKWLKANHSVEFVKLSADPSWGITEVLDGDILGYRFFPHKLRGEGFFLSVIRKLDPVRTATVKSRKPLPTPAAKVRDRLKAWVENPDGNRYFQFNDLLFYAPSTLADDFESLTQSMKVVYAGANVATLKHDKLIPEHALALSVELDKSNFSAIDVGDDDALKYLRREAIQSTVSTPGFALVNYKNTPLGWVNVLSSRVNNLYPAHWRIRMSPLPSPKNES